MGASPEVRRGMADACCQHWQRLGRQEPSVGASSWVVAPPQPLPRRSKPAAPAARGRVGAKTTALPARTATRDVLRPRGAARAVASKSIERSAPPARRTQRLLLRQLLPPRPAPRRSQSDERPAIRARSVLPRAMAMVLDAWRRRQRCQNASRTSKQMLRKASILAPFGVCR